MSFRRGFPVVAAVFYRVWSLVIRTLSIQFMTLPLSLYYSNAWGFSLIVSNLFLIPFFLLFVFSCALFFWVFWLPGGQWLAALIDAFGLGLSAASRLLDSWGGPSYFPQPEAWQLILFYFLLVAIYFLQRRWLRWLAVAAPALLLMSVPVKIHPAGRLTITMLDVGQGESIHVRYPDGSDALVDVGGRPPLGDHSRDFVGERVRRLRYVLLTHPHADHVQGYEFVRGRFRSASCSSMSTLLSTNRLPAWIVCERVMAS